MKKTTEKVLQRLAYERLLLVHGIEPQRKKITLQDYLEAARDELRLYEVLPAILMYRPSIISQVNHDLKKFPDIKKFADELFDEKSRDTAFYGIPAKECRKAALTYHQYLQTRQKQNKYRLFNLRLGDEDWERLTSLTRTLGTQNHSKTIRQLIEKAKGGPH